MKVMGIERKKCEYPGCNEVATVLVIHPWQGLNTHVLCDKHDKETSKKGTTN